MFLAGGNDGNNMIVPATTAAYDAYASVRSASGLAIARDSLLPIVPAGIGSPFGLHPSLLELQGSGAIKSWRSCATLVRSCSR